VSNPITILDEHSVAIARSLDIMILSTESLFEKFVREDPSLRGLKTFWSHASEIRERSVELVVSKMLTARNDLRASLSDSERLHSETHDDTEMFIHSVREAFRAFMSQVQTIYAKRFRDIAAARVFGSDTYNPDPRIVTGSGRKWNFTDYAFLTARQMLVDWYNTSKLDYLTENGYTEFTLYTLNPELMNEVYKVEDYPSIAEKLFHPRTTKLIGGPNVST